MNRLDVELEERRLARMMQEATHDLVPPADRLVAAGRRGGLRLHRRRQVVQLTGVCVVTVLLAGSVALVRPLLGSPGAGQPGPAASPGPVGLRPSAGRRSPFGVPAADMAATLATTLTGLPGAGTVSRLNVWSAEAGPAAAGPSLVTLSAGATPLFQPLEGASMPPSTPTGGPSPRSIDSLAPLESGASTPFRAGSLVYDDGQGPALVSIVVTAADAVKPGGASEDLDALCSRGTVCSTVPAGRLFVTRDVPEYPPARDTGVVSSIATLVTGEGVTVQATVYNAPAEKGAAATRSLPPLTGAQLGQLVSDPVWRS